MNETNPLRPCAAAACGRATEKTVVMLLPGQSWDTRPACSLRCAQRLTGQWTDADLEKVWEILVRCCGAREHDREDFLRSARDHVRKERSLEYRFIGNLGFGGKVWIEKWWPPRVSFYPEDTTTKRIEAMVAANDELGNL
jgi:hypothetical protein